MSRKGLVVSVNNIALSACEGYGVLRFVKGMEMCWFWCNMSLSSYGGGYKTVQSVSQDRGFQIQVQGTRDG